jgi:hypothetical protein
MQNPYNDDGDEGGQVSTQNTADVNSNDDEHREDKDEGKTYVVPKEICPDMKVGEEMVTEIVRVNDDSYEIKYAPEKGKGEDKGGEHEMGGEPEEGSMASMMD